MIQALKNQIVYLIGNLRPLSKRKEYRDKFMRIINGAMSDKELELSLIALLNELEK